MSHVCQIQRVKKLRPGSWQLEELVVWKAWCLLLLVTVFCLLRLSSYGWTHWDTKQYLIFACTKCDCLTIKETVNWCFWKTNTQQNVFNTLQGWGTGYHGWLWRDRMFMTADSLGPPLAPQQSFIVSLWLSGQSFQTYKQLPHSTNKRSRCHQGSLWGL